MFSAILMQAKSPLRRVGLLGVCAGAGLWISLGAYWSAIVQPLISIETVRHPQITARPDDLPGKTWRIADYGWNLFDDKCVEQRHQTAKGLAMFDPTPSITCIEKTIAFAVDEERVGRNSFPMFFKATLGPGYPGMRATAVGWTALILFTSGVLLYAGIADRLLKWIKSGS